MFTGSGVYTDIYRYYTGITVCIDCDSVDAQEESVCVLLVWIVQQDSVLVLVWIVQR